MAKSIEESGRSKSVVKEDDFPSDEDGPLDGLDQWLEALGLASRKADVVAWCKEQGACFLEELAEHSRDLGEALELEPTELEALVENSQAALAEVFPHKAGPQGLMSLRTLSSSGSSNVHHVASENILSKRSNSICPPVLTIPVDLGKALAKRSNSVAALFDLDTSEGVGGKESLERTATVQVGGTVSGIWGNLQLQEKTVSLRPESRRDAHRASVPEVSPPRRLTHTDTLGNFSEVSNSLRAKLVDDVHEDAVSPVELDHGQTGHVYALEAGGQKIAVFKPVDGEKFHRKSLDAGKGAVREEAVYLVDRLTGSQAAVPVTSRASIQVDGHTLEGSVQAFVMDVQGFIEDYGIPRKLEEAVAFIPQADAESIALLDMRDRHPGNLLLLKKAKPHGLGPIDHGCCLPPWWCLGEAIFEAWISWPQLQTPPSSDAFSLARAAHAKLALTCRMVAEAGLDPSAVVTLRLCTIFVYIGIVDMAIPIGKLAALMLRDDRADPQDLSWLEERANDRGDPDVRIEDFGDSLQVEPFIQDLEQRFRQDLKAFRQDTPESHGEGTAARRKAADRLMHSMADILVELSSCLDPDSIPSGLAWKMAREAATGIDTAVEPLLTGREVKQQIHLLGFELSRRVRTWHFAIVFPILPPEDGKKLVEDPVELWKAVFLIHDDTALPSFSVPMTMKEMIDMVWSKVWDDLERNGYDVVQFESIDGDETFVMLKARDINHVAEFAEARARLQPSAYDRALKKANACPCDRQDEKGAFQRVVLDEGLLPGEPITSECPHHVRYSRDVADKVEDFIVPEQLRMTRRHLRSLFSLVEMEKYGVITKFMALHEWEKLEVLYQRGWSSPRAMLEWPKESSSDVVEKYTGSRIAFFFHLYDLFTRWMVFPGFLSVALMLYQLFSAEHEELMRSIVGGLICIWATVFLARHEQLQNLKKVRWGLSGNVSEVA
eukprot:s718_g1.t1